MINKTLKLILDCVLKVLCILFHNNLSGISYVKSNILTSSVNFLSVYFSLIKSHFTRQFFYKSILLIFTYFQSDCFLTLKISLPIFILLLYREVFIYISYYYLHYLFKAGRCIKHINT